MTKEFENFDRTMRDLMSVPHDEIKAALKAEKEAKRQSKKKKQNTQESKNSKDRAK